MPYEIPLAPSGRPSVIAVFASPLWSNQTRLRLWAKQVTAGCVLLTEDVTDANVVLARQLRCSNVVVAHVRMGGTLRSHESLVSSRARRDRTMTKLADEIVVFELDANIAAIAMWAELRSETGWKITIYSE